MRVAARKDANQDEIRGFCERVGMKTATTHQLGSGFPDILVGTRGLTIVGDFDPERMADFILTAAEDMMVSRIAVYRGANILVEIKDGDKPPSKRKLTKDEKEWHAEWTGQVTIWESIHQASQELKLTR
jgi:hypothetical protein